MRIIVAALGLVASSVVAASAQPAQRCSHDAFSIGAQSVAVTVCAPAAAAGRTVPVTETFKGAAASFTHETAIDVVSGATVSRAIDDVSLTALGLPYTMHLTLAHRDASVFIEHALLLPGAVPLK